MFKDVAYVEAGMCVRDIAKLMQDEGVGCAPVKENGKVMGIITDRDITCRVVATGHDPETTTAKEIMTGDVSFCFDNDLLRDAADVMGKKRVRHLPVLNRDEELVGLLTVDDLAWQTDHKLLGQVIERIQMARKYGR
jgi:CBS domain-containing protein